LAALIAPSTVARPGPIASKLPTLHTWVSTEGKVTILTLSGLSQILKKTTTRADPGLRPAQHQLLLL